MELTPQTVLKDRYRIEKKLGQGGMGAVYLARDLSLDHAVAVKANLQPPADSANQFLREARLLATLRHPNLPRVTDYFILNGLQYLVMDYIPGQSLDQLLAGQGRLPVAQVLAWAHQLGGALSYMHHQNPPVIHRDIKPSNIRLSQEGEAILVDFGIAKALASDQVTETAAHSFTPGFAPPEQYGGLRTGPLSDQYALAATLYTLLAGQRPSDALQRALGQAVLTPLSTYAPETPPAFQAALERALSLRPEDRFASVDDFLTALGGAAIPTSRAAPVPVPPSPGQPPTPQAAAPAAASSNWLLWAILGAAGVGLLALLAGAVLLVLGVRNQWLGAAASPTAALALQATPTIPRDTPAPPASATPLPPTGTATPEPSTATLTPPPLSATPTAGLDPLAGSGQLAFASDRDNSGVMQIWLMQVGKYTDGRVVVTGMVQLTEGAGNKTQPRWSPDGSELLFVAPGEGANGLDIWRMPADGSREPVNLTQRKGDDTEPAWSPDGSLIAFTNNGRDDGVRQLYLMNADGSGQARLSYDQEEFGPTWSPDMQSLAFVMDASGRQILNLRGQSDPAVEQRPYYVTPQRFDFSTLAGSLGQVAQPIWSPTGSWIAYTRQDNGQEQIFAARYPLRDPNQEIVQLSDGLHDSDPSWSPDGQWLAFTSQRDGNPEIYLRSMDSEVLLDLSNSPGRDQQPAWQPLP